MPAKRSKSRQNWPVGLYSGTSKGQTYYRWLDPRSKKYVGLGRDLETAKQAARQKNAEIAADPVKRLLQKMDGAKASTTFKTACETWLALVRGKVRGRGDKTRRLSEKTVSDYEGFVRRFRAHFGDDASIESISLADISDYLDEQYEKKPRAHNYARGLLAQIWALAISKGWVKTNVPEQTLKLDHAVRSRRLTREQFDAIVEAAAETPEDAWFAPAARLALYCDQRRADVSSLPESAWDAASGLLVFTQDKTGHRVAVTAGPKLRKAVEDCLAVAPSGPGIIRKPGRDELVSPDMLTKTFARIRDQLIADRHSAWSGYKPTKPGVRAVDGRPPWRELRSLGAHLAKQAGIDAKALAGHATDAMEALYQGGHAKSFEATSL